MEKLICLLAIFWAGGVLTALLSVGWLMLLTYRKKQVSHMDESRWDAYFRGMSLRGMIGRGLLFLFLALWGSVPLVYGALRLFGFRHYVGLSVLFAGVTVAAVVIRCVHKRKYLQEKLEELKN